MTNKFQNLSGGISEKDPTGVKKAGNNLLLGIGNVLDASAVNFETREHGETNEEETPDESKVNVTKVCILSKLTGILVLVGGAVRPWLARRIPDRVVWV